MVLVVDEKRVLPHLAHRDDLGGAVLADAHAALTIGTEAHGLAMPKVDALSSASRTASKAPSL